MRLTRVFPARAAVGAVVALALIPLGGCGPSAKTGSVVGTVKLDGKPVADATVTFLPANGQAVAASTDANGNYQADEVPVGLAAVGVVSQADSGEQVALTEKQLASLPPEERTKKADEAKRKKTPKVPDKYRDPSASGLTHTVTEAATRFDITLTK